MGTYSVIGTIKYKGKIRKVGGLIELPDDLGDDLVSQGLVAPATVSDGPANTPAEVGVLTEITLPPSTVTPQVDGDQVKKAAAPKKVAAKKTAAKAAAVAK